jgi:uncharacterized secreted protein with C-terminal beta-propeller domain
VEYGYGKWHKKEDKTNACKILSEYLNTEDKLLVLGIDERIILKLFICEWAKRICMKFNSLILISTLTIIYTTYQREMS